MKRSSDARGRSQAEAQLTELDNAERRMIEVESSIAEYLDQVAVLENGRADVVLSQKIEAGLGVAKVDGEGRLVDIELNLDSVRTSNPDLLGVRVLRALEAARTNMNNQYMQELSRLKRLVVR